MIKNFALRIFVFAFYLLVGLGSSVAHALTFDTPPFSLGTAQAYFSKDNVFGSVANNEIFDVFLPKAQFDSRTPTPFVMYIHGGGFIIGEKEGIYNTIDGRNLITGLLTRGIGFVSINYTLLEQYGETVGVSKCVESATFALQYLRRYASTYNFDKTKVVLYGGSAGASTALWIATYKNMADPTSVNLTERESTRVKGVAVTATQSTLNAVRWETLFKQFGTKLSMFPLETTRLYGVDDLSEVYVEPTVSYRKEMDFYAHMDSWDPEIWVESVGVPNSSPNADTNILYHHPLHAKALMDRAAAVGMKGVFNIPVLGIYGNESMIDFMARKLQ